MAPHTHHNHQGDPTLPCGTCRKRHVRSNDSAIARGTSDSARSTRRASSSSSSSPFSKSGIAIAVLALASASSLAAGHPSSVIVAKQDAALHPSLTLEASSGVGKRWMGDASSDAFEIVRKLNAIDTGLEVEEDDLHVGEEDEDHLEEEDHLNDEEVEELHEEEDDHEEEEDHLHEEEDGHDEDDHDNEDHDEEDDHDHEEDDHDHEDHDVENDDHDGDTHDGHDHSSSLAQESSSAQTVQNESTSQPWGKVIGATLLVNLASLIGLLLVVIPAMHRGYLKFKGVPAAEINQANIGHGRFFDICIPAFAVGALMATAVFLVFPEAMHLIEGGHAAHEGEGGDDAHADHRLLQDDHDDHVDHSEEAHEEEGPSESLSAARFGMSVLGGFLLPVFLSILFHHTDEIDIVAAKDGSVIGDDAECASCTEDIEIGVTVMSTLHEKDGAPPTDIIHKIEDTTPQDFCESECCKDTEEVQAEQPLVTKTFVNRRLCASILIGDAFHNFADGLFMGAAFLSCDVGTAMSIVVVTVFHEMAQELADFILLTQYAGLSVWKACILNFTSGLAVTLGGIVVIAGKPSEVVIGVILAMAGGVYINVAACETIPRIEKFLKTRGDRALTLLSFIVGTVPIGLILLNHQHCG